MQIQIIPFTAWGYFIFIFFSLKTFEKVQIKPFLGGFSYKIVHTVHTVQFFSKPVAGSSQIPYQKLRNRWTPSGHSIEIYKVFVQINTGSSTPVIILLITANNTGDSYGGFHRRVSKKYLNINGLNLPA